MFLYLYYNSLDVKHGITPRLSQPRAPLPEIPYRNCGNFESFSSNLQAFSAEFKRFSIVFKAFSGVFKAFSGLFQPVFGHFEGFFGAFSAFFTCFLGYLRQKSGKEVVNSISFPSCRKYFSAAFVTCFERRTGTPP